MLQGLSGWHLVIILFIILLLFGAPKLPGLARSLGQSMKILKKEVRSDEGKTGDDEAADAQGAVAADPASSSAAPATAATAASADAELAKARAEAETAKAELEALKLRAQAEKRDQAEA